MTNTKQYIERVNTIREIEGYDSLVGVDVTCECNGSKRRIRRVMSRTEWDEVAERGYF